MAELNTATEVAQSVSRRETSSVDTAMSALNRIAQLDSTLHAFVEVLPEIAISHATRVDDQIKNGARLLLAGVPIGVKASQGLASPHTQRLIQAGAVPVGLTATPLPETDWQTYGHTSRGPTLNPHNPDLTPGGSSAGSAVAVAAGMVPLATGSDGAGSIRIPAAWCGIWGWKLTRGLWDARDRSGFATNGPLVAAPEDLLLYAGVVGELLPPQSVSRAVFSADLGFAEIDPAIAELTREVAETVTTWSWVDCPVQLVDPASIWTASRATAQSNPLCPNQHALDKVFETVDIIVTPTTPHPAHAHGGPGERMNVSLTWAFNVSGHPAISVPMNKTYGGAPIGLQIVGRRGHDMTLLHLAQQIHQMITV